MGEGIRRPHREKLLVRTVWRRVLSAYLYGVMQTPLYYYSTELRCMLETILVSWRFSVKKWRFAVEQLFRATGMIFLLLLFRPH